MRAWWGAWWIFGAVSVGALAGCVSETDSSADAGSDNRDGGASLGADGNGTVTNATLEPPALVVMVAGDGVNATDNGTRHSAPLEANVTFDASNTTDPAGGNVSFAWDFGDGNNATGPVVSHVFAAPGAFNVTVFATSDASGLTANQTLAVEIVGEPIPPPVVLKGSALVFQPLHSSTCIDRDIDGNFYALPQNLDDWNFKIVPSSGTTWVAYWYATSYLGSHPSQGKSEGTVVPGSTRAHICMSSGVNGSFTMTITHADYVEPA